MAVDQLKALECSLAAQTDTVREMFKGNPDAVLIQQPLPGKWSVAEHTEHLTLVNNHYLASIGMALEQARSKGWVGEGPYKRRWLADKLIQSMEPPPRQRVPTFRKVVPPLTLDCASTLARFDEAQSKALATLEQAKGLDLGKAQLRSPLFPLLKLSAFQGFLLIDAHNRRHIWHMERALEAAIQT